MSDFITDDFLLHNKTARTLYHDYAEKMPIYDYHCHLPAELIAGDHQFKNITEAWLHGDHYKWRALRTNGIDEKYITGSANDYEKFEKWARTVPYCLRNPLYHWTHLELKRHFGISELLNPQTAKTIYDTAGAMLQSKEFSVKNLIRMMNVKLLCTTEGPLDDLCHHQKIRVDGFEVNVHTAWRPDKAFAVDDIAALNKWIDSLGQLADVEISSYEDYLTAIGKRHDYFHENGCRLSDYGIEKPYAETYTASEIDSVFTKIRSGKTLNPDEKARFRSAMLYDLVTMDAESSWVMQLHIGAIRSNNTLMFKKVGPDSGFDSMGDLEIAKPLGHFLDNLAVKNNLPRTILYNINPRDNEVLATMMGNFQGTSMPGKLQLGSGWWFLDQKYGIEKQLNVLSNMSLLSRFVGMLTDSRSFLSYPRHEYFRRILCNMLGKEVEEGLLPNDLDLLGQMVADISFNNAKKYFPMTCD